MASQNIDCRGATRQVPMQVLGLGMPRTGTASLRMALEILGYKETNHGFAMWANLSEISMWTEAINAKFFGKGKLYGREEWDQLLGHCMAIIDVPHILFAEELIAAYPSAKIILTTHDPDSWWRSYVGTVIGALTDHFGALNAWLKPDIVGKPRAFWSLAFCTLFNCEPGDLMPEIAKAPYVRYFDEVRALAKASQGSESSSVRVLEYRLGEGLERLCEFLGKPVPEEVFPRLNDTQWLNSWIRQRSLSIWKTVALKYGASLMAMSTALIKLYYGTQWAS